METKQFKDKQGNELKIGDRVKYYSYKENKPYNAIIESFAKSTVKISFIGSKNKKWTNPEIYLELITDDTEERLILTRGEIKYIMELLEEHSCYKTLAYLKKIIK